MRPLQLSSSTGSKGRLPKHSAVPRAQPTRPTTTQYAQQEPCALPVTYDTQAPWAISTTATHCQLCTLVTQCSLDRWPRFLQQAASWGGPVSVAVYIPAAKPTTAAEAALATLHTHIKTLTEQHGQQPLVVSVLFANHIAREGASAVQRPGLNAKYPLIDQPQESTDPTSVLNRPSYDQLYPINALRNLALQQVSTPLVLSVDSDFIISRGLQQTLQEPWALQLLGVQPLAQDQGQQQAQQQQMYQRPVGCQNPQQQQQWSLRSSLEHQQVYSVMLVVPIFQLVLQQDLPDTQAAAVPQTKADLAAALAAGTVEPFHCGVFPPAHQPVDVAEWLSADVAYDVQFVEYFEPQGVAVRGELPLYDERFRGYGLNKVQHAWHMHRLGFRFKVLPDAFMVTAPHKRSPTWRPLPGTAQDEEHLDRIRAVYQDFKDGLEQLIA